MTGSAQQNGPFDPMRMEMVLFLRPRLGTISQPLKHILELLRGSHITGQHDHGSAVSKG